MARRLISSGSTFEKSIGYSRALVDGDWIFVSGTTGFDYSTMTIGAYPGYELRPESLESAYYMYRLTGDDRYRQMGGAMWDAIERWTRSESGFAALAAAC